MALHIVHFIGPINHSSACTIRNLCLQALQSGATEIELHLSTEGGNMTAGFALYFFLKSLPLPLTTHNIGSVESIGVVIFLAGHKRYACPGTRFLVHPLHWGFGNLVAADHSRVSRMARMPRLRCRTLRQHLRGGHPRRRRAGRHPHPPVRQRAHLRRRPGAGRRHRPRGDPGAPAERRRDLALVERLTARNGPRTGQTCTDAGVDLESEALRLPMPAPQPLWTGPLAAPSSQCTFLAVNLG